MKFIPANPKFAEAWQVWRNEEATLQFNPVLDSTYEEICSRLAQESGGCG